MILQDGFSIVPLTDEVRGWRFKVVDHSRNAFMKSNLREQIVQEFLYRCPYCDEPVSYGQFDLKTGENEVQCLSCRKTYIKVVGDCLKDVEEL